MVTGEAMFLENVFLFAHQSDIPHIVSGAGGRLLLMNPGHIYIYMYIYRERERGHNMVMGVLEPSIL